MTDTIASEPTTSGFTPTVERIKVELMGLHVGSAETWDQFDETTTTFSDFKPEPEFADRFPKWELMDLNYDPFGGVINVINTDPEVPESSNNVNFVFGLLKPRD